MILASALFELTGISCLCCLWAKCLYKAHSTPVVCCWISSTLQLWNKFSKWISFISLLMKLSPAATPFLFIYFSKRKCFKVSGLKKEKSWLIFLYIEIFSVKILDLTFFSFSSWSSSNLIILIYQTSYNITVSEISSNSSWKKNFNSSIGYEKTVWRQMNQDYFLWISSKPILKILCY